MVKIDATSNSGFLGETTRLRVHGRKDSLNHHDQRHNRNVRIQGDALAR
jgi:hypothetical protein